MRESVRYRTKNAPQRWRRRMPGRSLRSGTAIGNDLSQEADEAYALCP